MTPEQRAVLAHKVSDPDKWVADARVYAIKAWNQDVAQLAKARDALIAENHDSSMAEKLDGILAKQKELTDAGHEPYFQRFLTEKVARWQKEYAAESAKPGYKTRAERDAIEGERAKKEADAAALRKAEAEARKKAEFDEAVRAAVLALNGNG